MNVNLVTLGCSKNQVDSEMLLGYLEKKGFNIVGETKNADIIIVNTCGFINSAKEEAINTLLDMAEYKNEDAGRCKCLIAVGCLAKRYKQNILDEMPEVDLVIGVDEYPNIDNIINNFFNERNLKLASCNGLNYKDRIISTVFPMAYLRISDGCDNRCAYCAIPFIRGKFVSRKMEDIVEEAEILVSRGVQELVVISQDTSRYGMDIYDGKYMLAELLRRLAKIEGVKWVRVLYLYPCEITDELIDTIASNDKICNYFDIPIQHLNDDLLLAMNRRGNKKDIYDVIAKIRERVQDPIIRTTVITGFPGETKENFEELVEGIKELKFDRLGCFAFSREEDTKAYDMENQIDYEVAKKREEEVMMVQQKISLENNKKYIGREVEVLIEGVSEDEEYFVCRSYMDAPDVDGRIYIKLSEVEDLSKVIVGGFYKAEIIDYSAYDLYAKLIY